MPELKPLYVLGATDLDTPFQTMGQHLTSAESVRSAFVRHRKAWWVIVRPTKLGHIFSHIDHSDTFHRALMLEALSAPKRELLSSYFRAIVAPGNGVKLLPPSDLVEVLGAEDPEDYFIGGVVDHEADSVVLIRGNLDRLVVNLSWFRTGSSGSSGSPPDPHDFEVIDCGQTIRLGAYEAAADAIVYEFDTSSRKRMNERKLEHDTSFGACLRRLRLSKGLSRSDFGEINAKTIARIERGEVAQPRTSTLAAVAKRLGVEPEKMDTY